MPRTELDHRLGELRVHVAQLGVTVDDAIDHSMAALAAQDTDIAQHVIAGDDAIDEGTATINALGACLITRHQPVLGDLRAVLAALAIADELERIGDHAEGIARLVTRLPQAPDATALRALQVLAALARVQLQDALDAYRAGNVQRASVVWRADADVDALCHRLVGTLMTALGDDQATRTSSTYLLWIAHNIERIADRAGNICERVVYIATGERRIAIAS